MEAKIKAAVFDKIRTIVDVPSDFSARVIPSGTEGVIVECYEHPEGYAVDLAIPDKTLVSGFDYENVILRPEQFTVIMAKPEEQGKR